MSTFGPGHREWCPNSPEDDPGHCGCWYECEPCHRCGDDTPDPNCDCERCTYVRQETTGYPNGELRQAPDLEAPWPSGMCGKRRVCEHCPSHFLCWMKAKAEIGSREALDLDTLTLAAGDHNPGDPRSAIPDDLPGDLLEMAEEVSECRRVLGDHDRLVTAARLLSGGATEGRTCWPEEGT